MKTGGDPTSQAQLLDAIGKMAKTLEKNKAELDELARLKEEKRSAEMNHQKTYTEKFNQLFVDMDKQGILKDIPGLVKVKDDVIKLLATPKSTSVAAAAIVANLGQKVKSQKATIVAQDAKIKKLEKDLVIWKEQKLEESKLALNKLFQRPREETSIRASKKAKTTTVPSAAAPKAGSKASVAASASGFDFKSLVVGGQNMAIFDALASGFRGT